MSILSKLLDLLSSIGGRGPTHRAQRVTLAPLHNLQFTTNLLEQESLTLSVVNISTSGMGLLKDRDDGHWPKEGTVLKGTLTVNTAQFSLALKIVHHTGRTMGASFVAAPTELKRALEEYFAAELTGLSLTEVNSEILKKEEDGSPRWFRGKGNAELYFVEDAEGVLRFHLTFLGVHITGRRGGQARHGFLAVDEDSITENGELKYKASSVARLSTAPLAPELATAAIRLLNQITALTPQERKQILKITQGV